MNTFWRNLHLTSTDLPVTTLFPTSIFLTRQCWNQDPEISVKLQLPGYFTIRFQSKTQPRHSSDGLPSFCTGQPTIFYTVRPLWRPSVKMTRHELDLAKINKVICWNLNLGWVSALMDTHSITHRPLLFANAAE